MIEVVDNVDKFAAIAEMWRNLEKCEKNRIFQTFAWVWNGWQCFMEKDSRNSLYILKWTHEKSESGLIAPFYIDCYGRLRFIMDDYSDICDVVYGDSINLRLAVAEIAGYIYKNPKVKSVWLQKMPSVSEALNELCIALNGSVVGKDNAYSWLRVLPAADFIANQTHMKSKDRADLKNLKRQGDKYKLRVLKSSQADVFPETEIIALRDAMRKSGRRGSAYFSDDDIEFLRRIYREGICDIAVLEQGGYTQAINAFLKKGDRIISWVFLYSNPKSSTILYIKFFCENHIQTEFVFDFGIGVYSYKIGTFRPHVGLTFSLFHSNRICRRIAGLITMGWRFLKDIAKAGF